MSESLEIREEKKHTLQQQSIGCYICFLRLWKYLIAPAILLYVSVRGAGKSKQNTRSEE